MKSWKSYSYYQEIKIINSKNKKLIIFKMESSKGQKKSFTAD